MGVADIVLHAHNTAEDLEVAALDAQIANARVVEIIKQNGVLQTEYVAMQELVIIATSKTCPEAPACPVLEPVACPKPIECPPPTVCQECPEPPKCEPEILTIRIVEKEEVIKEVLVPVSCTRGHTDEAIEKLEGFVPYLDLLGSTDGSAGARLGIDKELAQKGRFSFRLFAELSHDLIEVDQDLVDFEMPEDWYCSEDYQKGTSAGCSSPGISDNERTRGNLGIRFRF